MGDIQIIITRIMMKHIRKRRNCFLCSFPISLTSLRREVANRLYVQRTLSPGKFPSNLRRGCGDSTMAPAVCQFLSDFPVTEKRNASGCPLTKPRRMGIMRVQKGAVHGG